MSELSLWHKETINLMKDQLLIVLINRLGGKINIPIKEIDDTGKYNLSMQLNQETKSFYFEVGEKGNE